MDSIDAVCVEFGPDFASGLKVQGFLEIAMEEELRQRLVALREADTNILTELCVLDRLVAQQFAAATEQLLNQCNLKVSDIAAIGSHGQTVLHGSNKQGHGFSLQIGDPNSIAELTGIDTIADFRRRDIAAGGEGAPLAPAFHREFLSDAMKSRAIINLGGIANITWLSPAGKKIIGFDCGPANALLDVYHQHCGRQGLYDRDSHWAQSGTVNEELLQLLLEATDYFKQLPPKSTGKELFNLNYINTALQMIRQVPLEVDVQRTLLQLSVETIAIGLQQCPIVVDEIICCGGGAHNQFLLQQLSTRTGLSVTTSEPLGIASKQIEALAFAWLAKQNCEGRATDLTDITGASKPELLGVLYRAS